jgi:hypothetical protein
MACDSHYQRFILNGLFEMTPDHFLLIIGAIFELKLYFSLFFQDELPNPLGGFISIHSWHVAVHEYDPIKAFMLIPKLYEKV